MKISKVIFNFLAFFLIVSLSACRKEPPSSQQPSIDALAARITAMADEYIKEALIRFPEQAEFLGLADASHDRLTDNSLVALRAWQEIEDRWAAGLSQMDSSLLWGRQEWLTYGYLSEIVEASRRQGSPGPSSGRSTICRAGRRDSPSWPRSSPSGHRRNEPRL